jgi:hypothetical protein
MLVFELELFTQTLRTRMQAQILGNAEPQVAVNYEGLVVRGPTWSTLGGNPARTSRLLLAMPDLLDRAS